MAKKERKNIIHFFAFFTFTIHGEKRKKKYHSLIKEPFPAEGGFIVPSPFIN